jgi:adenylate cyclase
MKNLSPATGLAWQAAASEALQQRAAWIEPHHLLIGASSVGKMLQQIGSDRQPIAGQDRAQIQREAEDFAGAMAEASVDIQNLRRTLRALGGAEAAPGPIAPVTKMRRSIASQEVFTRAEAIADTHNSDQLELVHLSAALLELRDEKIDAVFEKMGKRKEDLRLALLRRATTKGNSDSNATAENEPLVEISHSMDASDSHYPYGTDTAKDEVRSALLYELPLLFGTAASLTDLLQGTLRRIQQVIPAASHAALLTKDRVTNELLLLAHVPAGTPLVSQTLAKRVMDSRKACIWIRGEEDATASLNAYGVHSGIYAPLLWQNEVLGVFLLSSQDPKAVLSPDDLRLIVALAHHAAMALAGAQLQNDLRRKSELLERMLTNFSPRIRSALLEKASRGSLRLGGEKSEVTVLCSDVRGFTKTSEKLTTDEVVDLLNDYFSGLVDAIFQHDGTIDKFLGDGILAVFGSPERDPAQHHKALRAALAMQEAMKKRNEARSARGLTICEIGIGVHCGEVFHGFIGSADRMEFTVIGDAVNRTARYCAGAKGAEILISPNLFQHAWNVAEVEPTRIGTKHEGEFEAYRLKGIKAI